MSLASTGYLVVRERRRCCNGSVMMRPSGPYGTWMCAMTARMARKGRRVTIADLTARDTSENV